MKVVLGLSGGMDSATLLGYYLESDYEVHCCSFYYGSKHGEYELKAAKKIVEFYKGKGKKVEHHIFDVQSLFAGFKSSLLQGQGEIPEGHYEADNMKQTVVPGRNLIFASIMAGLAESIEAMIVALGTHSGDHHIYPDCRPDFNVYLDKTIQESTENKVVIQTPFMKMNKTDILKLGYAFGIQVPYHLTRTCYKQQEKSCGKCGSCQERLEAFKAIMTTDPIEYE